MWREHLGFYEHSLKSTTFISEFLSNTESRSDEVEDDWIKVMLCGILSYEKLEEKWISKELNFQNKNN